MEPICFGNIEAIIIVNVVMSKYLFPNRPPKMASTIPFPENVDDNNLDNVSEIVTITNDKATVIAISFSEISLAPQYLETNVSFLLLSSSVKFSSLSIYG